MENQDFKEPLPIEKPAARSFIENASNFLFPSYQSPQRASSPQSSTAPSSRQKVRLEPGHSHMDWASKKKSFAPNQLRRITISEMKLHNKKEDLWITVQGKVYTCTEYISYHPGGRSQLMRGAGIDATDLFMKVHSWVNIESLLKECCLGYLVPDE